MSHDREQSHMELPPTGFQPGEWAECGPPERPRGPMQKLVELTNEFIGKKAPYNFGITKLLT